MSENFCRASLPKFSKSPYFEGSKTFFLALKTKILKIFLKMTSFFLIFLAPHFCLTFALRLTFPVDTSTGKKLYMYYK